MQLAADRNKQHQFTNFAAIWEKMLDLLSVSWHSQQNTHHLWSFLWKSVNGTYSAKISQARNQLYKMKVRPRNPPSVSNPGVNPKLPSFVELRIVKIGMLKKWCSQFFLVYHHSVGFLTNYHCFALAIDLLTAVCSHYFHWIVPCWLCPNCALMIFPRCLVSSTLLNHIQPLYHHCFLIVSP